MAKKKLTHLQRRFVNNILKGLDGKAAYIRAGYRARGAAAEAAASRLLRNVKVKKTVKAAQKRAAFKAEITAERILREEMCLAFFNPQGLVDEEGKLLDLNILPEEVARAIMGLEVISQPKGKLKFKYRFSDKGKSLERLEKYKGMFAPLKHEITGKNGTALDLTAIVLKVTKENESAGKN
jgi:phage terminase small subunit